MTQHMRGRFEAISASATSFVGPGFPSRGGIERKNIEAGAMDKAPVAEADKLTSAEEVVENPFPPNYLESSALIGFGRETRSTESGHVSPQVMYYDTWRDITPSVDSHTNSWHFVADGMIPQPESGSKSQGCGAHSCSECCLGL